jgi:hypothetical protein
MHYLKRLDPLWGEHWLQALRKPSLPSLREGLVREEIIVLDFAELLSKKFNPKIFK